MTVEGGRPIDWLRAITDRGVDVLLVPEGRSLTAAAAASPAGLRFSADPDHAEEEDSHAKLALHAADRLISECWVYSPFGRVSGGDVSVRFNPGGAGKEKDLVSWVRNDPIRAPLLRAVPACTVSARLHHFDRCTPPHSATHAFTDATAHSSCTALQVDAIFHSSESSEGDEPSPELQAALDEANAAGGVLEQTFRRAPLEEALQLL